MALFHGAVTDAIAPGAHRQPRWTKPSLQVAPDLLDSYVAVEYISQLKKIAK
jgi:hypothetical protein